MRLKVGKSIIVLVQCLLAIIVILSLALGQEQQDPVKGKKLTGEQMREMSKAVRDSVYKARSKEVSRPKIHFSEGVTGKEIQYLVMELKSEDELDFLHNMGIDCCYELGICSCEVTLEQMAEIMVQGIKYRRISEKELQRREERREIMKQQLERVNLGPNDVIVASLQVSTKEDLAFLRSIGMECCVDTGMCECQITKEQWEQIGSYGFRGGAQVRDTTTWGKDTRRNSRKTPPPKPTQKEKIGK